MTTTIAILRDLLDAERSLAAAAQALAAAQDRRNELANLAARALAGYEIDYTPAASKPEAKPPRACNRAGEVVGAWTIIARGRNSQHLICRCECGNERQVHLSTLARARRLGVKAGCASCATRANMAKRWRREKEAVV